MNKIVKVCCIVFIGLLSLAGALCILLTVGGTGAKYTAQESDVFNGELYSFKVSPIISYTTDEGTVKTITEEDLKNNNGILRLSVSEYNTLNASIKYTGKGKAYARCRLIESWQHIDSENNVEMITPKELSEYTISENVYDNRSDDSYLYYKEVLSGENDEDTISIVNKFKAGLDASDLLSPDDKSTFVDISISTEGVQWNRAKDIWSMNSFPWEK